MKLNKLALTLTAAALLPAFAHAGTDAVTASFDRDFTHEPVKSVAITGNPDAFTAEFYAALNGNADAISASFERDMHRVPANIATVIAGEPDALTVEFNVALTGKADPVLASFDRDMYRAPVNAVVAITGEPDVLTTEFYAALYSTPGKPVMHATTGGRLGS